MEVLNFKTAEQALCTDWIKCDGKRDWSWYLSKLNSSMRVQSVMHIRRGPRKKCYDLRGGGERPDLVREVLPQRSPHDHQGVPGTNTKGESLYHQQQMMVKILAGPDNEPWVGWNLLKHHGHCWADDHTNWKSWGYSWDGRGWSGSFHKIISHTCYAALNRCDEISSSWCLFRKRKHFFERFQVGLSGPFWSKTQP